MKKQFRDFENARKFAQSLKLKYFKDWKDYAKSGKLPKDIPRNPHAVYKKEWKGWGDFLGTGRIGNQNKTFRSFTEARKFARQSKISSQTEWQKYCKSGKNPKDIPYAVRQIYKKEWKGWGDFLGTGNVAPSDRKFKDFEEAKIFVRKLKFKNRDEWKQFIKTNKFTNNIPKDPATSYKNKGWKGWGDFLGTGRVANQNRKYLSFNKAREYVRKLNLKNQTDWRDFSRSKNKPENIPANPESVYKNKEWTNWGDFLGTGRVANQNRKYLSFNKAREYVRKLNLKSRTELQRYFRSGKIPMNIPSIPERVYEKEWNGMGDWLGTGRVANQIKSKNWLPFNESKKIAIELRKKYNLKTWDDWFKAYDEGKIPRNIPKYPNEVYAKNKRKRK